MWNSIKYMAMATAAAGLSVAAAAPASAQYWGTNGEYTAYGHNPWNQGSSGGPWLRAPWNPAPSGGTAQANWAPPAYGYGWPAATYDAARYGLSSTYGYGGSYRAVAYGGGLENGQSPPAAAAPMPERTRSIVRRRGPKRLE